MKKLKKQKNKRKKKLTFKKRLVKKVKKIKKKPSKSRRRKAKVASRATRRKGGKNDEVLKMERLISRGKERGFVTFDEILKEFPTIETNIIFLDELYKTLHTLGVDILEGGGLLEMPEEETGKRYAYSRGDSSYDSIQMYLREIGQYPLIAGSMEKELAKRIEGGD